MPDPINPAHPRGAATVPATAVDIVKPHTPGLLQLTPRALERRLKRHLVRSEQNFLAITTPAFESALAQELRRVPGAQVGGTIPGGVEFSGPFECVYDANLRLRTASRVLMRIDSFIACSYPELFNKCRRAPWELYIGFSDAISISVSSRHSRLHHTGNISRAVHDAILDSMGKLGRAPGCSDDAPITFNIRLAKDVCTISVDSSGDPLYKRGYRTNVGKAPLRENIAAALLIASSYDDHDVIVDPFCGSGGIVLECAMLALNRCPGAGRAFAFEHWPSFAKGKFDRARNRSVGEQHESTKLIVGADKSSAAINAARRNATAAGLERALELRVHDMFQTDFSQFAGRKGLIVSNLPYGKRIGTGREARELYKKMGGFLKDNCRGWSFGFVAPESFRELSGLQISSVIGFENGGLPVVYFQGKL